MAEKVTKPLHIRQIGCDVARAAIDNPPGALSTERRLSSRPHAPVIREEHDTIALPGKPELIGVQR